MPGRVSLRESGDKSRPTVGPRFIGGPTAGGYAEQGTFPTKYDLTAQFKGRGGEQVPATTVQMLADRLSKSLKRFLAARELGIPDVGFPRFKKPNRWHSI